MKRLTFLAFAPALALTFALAMVALLASPAVAVEPDEMLADPALEARAREVSQELRCLVCQNESIDESNATLAKDLRLLVRARITAGDSNDEVIDYVVERYGEFVLLKPLAGGANVILWWAGPVMLLIALATALAYLRRRGSSGAPQEAALSAEEEARLRDILKQ